MERSVLDRKSTRVLNFPLTVNQQLWLVFLLPSVIEATFFTMDLATDLAIGIEFLRTKHIWGGLTTLFITYLAPLVCYIMHIINPPAENEFKKLVRWVAVETASLFLYALRPIQCFAERLFWAIEATRLEEPLREEALRAFEATRTFTIENYLFLQGLLHAGPQAIFQTALLVLKYTDDPHIEKMQALGIATSLMSLSLVTTSYHRYETQAKGGRARVWKVPTDTTDEEEPTVLIASGVPSESVPMRKKWTKVMDEDNPLGKLVLFLFWYSFYIGRILALILAANCYPWVTLIVCTTHFVFSLLYILLSPNCRISIPEKLLLSFVFVFCLIEVGIQFAKSFVFFGLFFSIICIENIGLALVWTLWGSRSGFWYDNAIYIIIITQVLAALFVSVYMKYFRPPIRRLRPTR